MPTLQEVLSQHQPQHLDLDYNVGWSGLRPDVQQKLADAIMSGNTDVFGGSLSREMFGARDATAAPPEWMKLSEAPTDPRAKEFSMYFDPSHWEPGQAGGAFGGYVPEGVDLTTPGWYKDLTKERLGTESSEFFQKRGLQPVLRNLTGGFNISDKPEYEGAFADPSRIEYDPRYGLYTPASNFAGQLQHKGPWFSEFMKAAIPALAMGVVTGGLGSAAAAGLGGGTLGSAAGYGASGALTGAAGAGLTGGDVGKGALLGGLGGAVGGGLSSLSGTTGAGMTGSTLGDKALTGAAKGLTGAALRGGDLGDIGESLLLGGVSGGLNTLAPGLGGLASTGYKLANAPDHPVAPSRRPVTVSRRPAAAPVTGALTAATLPVRQPARRSRVRAPALRGLNFR